VSLERSALLYLDFVNLPPIRAVVSKNAEK